MRFLLPELKDNGDKVEVRKALLDAEKSINDKNDSQDAQISTNTSNIATNTSNISSIFTTLSALKTVVITGNYTLQNDDSQIFVNTDSALTITVPASFPVNRPFRVKRISSGLTTNAVTVAFTGATIYGAASIALFGNSYAKTVKYIEQFDVEKITSTTAELTAGMDSGTNINGYFLQSFDGSLRCDGIVSCAMTTSLSNWFGSTSGTSYFGNTNVTFAKQFVNVKSTTSDIISNGASSRIQSLTLSGCIVQGFNGTSVTGDITYSIFGTWR